jgi:hypothetical protein
LKNGDPLHRVFNRVLKHFGFVKKSKREKTIFRGACNILGIFSENMRNTIIFGLTLVLAYIASEKIDYIIFDTIY